MKMGGADCEIAHGFAWSKVDCPGRHYSISPFQGFSYGCPRHRMGTTIRRLCRDEESASGACRLGQVAKTVMRLILGSLLSVQADDSCPSPKLDSSAFSTTSIGFLPTKIFEIKN
jgi:hypothetical protein